MCLCMRTLSAQKYLNRCAWQVTETVGTCLQADAGGSICELTRAVVVASSQSLKGGEAVVRIARGHSDALPGSIAHCQERFLLVLHECGRTSSSFGNIKI